MNEYLALPFATTEIPFGVGNVRHKKFYQVLSSDLESFLNHLKTSEVKYKNYPFFFGKQDAFDPIDNMSYEEFCDAIAVHLKARHAVIQEKHRGAIG